jgi:hypothetical protein
MPDRGDWSVHMPSLLSVIAAARRSSCSPVTVIFHCMESIRRGPRCARRLYLELQMLAQSADEDLSPPLAIKILQGGADQWVRNFYSDARLEHGYNNDIWGYLDD